MAESLDINPGVGRVSNIDFAFIPYEPFDTNGYFNYVPSKLGFDYSCYERNQCKHEPGTGEQVADRLVQILKNLHSN